MYKKACLWREILQNMLAYISDKPKFTEVNYHHCGTGIHSIGVTVDGKINTCQEHNTYINGDIFCIGDVFNGIDTQKHINLLTDEKL